jgi:hypothetical protein
MRVNPAAVVGAWLCAALHVPAAAQSPRPLMPIEFQHSAEFGWLQKPVLASRVLEDMTDPGRWTFSGTGTLTFPSSPAMDDMPVLRVDMTMFTDSPAPTRNRLSSVNLRRAVDGEDWSGYNRLSIWLRADISGIPVLPLQVVLHNDGAVKVPDTYRREGTHYVTLQHGRWQQVMWEITPLARDRVTLLEVGYWVNKMLADPGDHVAFEIGRIELQRVEPDHYEGWTVAPGRIAFSHSGYQAGSPKTALMGAAGVAGGGSGAASGTATSRFRLVRVDGNALADIAFTGPIETVRTRLGEFRQLDFSAVREPGTYVIQAGDIVTRPFRIGDDVWRSSVLKALNWLYGQRCGWHVPGSHDVDHRDWLAVHGDLRIPLNGGWHDAGDLSQGMVNTGEAVYALFALAARLQATGEDPELLERVLEEAKWGLDWVLRVRFPGGYRMGFASHNLWTNGIIGDADDRVREPRNNPNVNYIAAAAAAIAARVLRDSDPHLAARSLAIAEDDWRHAIVGVEGPETWHTPAFAATPVELAGIGITASLELYQATGARQYADKAVELARTIIASQQRSYVGSDYPLAGFFHTGPDRATIFTQFHRGNDQAPIVALARLVSLLPEHAEWMQWYAALALYSDYQKAAARTTEPYGVLPAYVYRDGDEAQVPLEGALHMATREAYREQVRHGMSMGDGHFLRAFPVWFARRGNYGILLSQAKAVATTAHVRRDLHDAALAQQQAQWIVGRNPFTQSTMYGEGYDWSQQYAVSSGDFVGALPVGMQSRGATDLPYWPAQNMYVYKEVWIHPVSRWIWLMRDIAGPGIVEVRTAPGAARSVVLESGDGRAFTIDVASDGRGRSIVPEGRYTARVGGGSGRGGSGTANAGTAGTVATGTVATGTVATGTVATGGANGAVVITVLPGSVRDIDLRPGRALDLTLESATASDGTVTLRATARGSGTHTLALRTHNLDVRGGGSRTVSLQAGRAGVVEWRGRPATADAPWVAVVIPNGDAEQRVDASGGRRD